MKPMLPLIALALATTTPLAHSAEVISADRGHAEIRGKFIHLECKPLL